MKNTLTNMAGPCLLAFGFGNLAMLGWLAAAVAPLLIHLWSRQRAQETPWAAMHLLQAAMRKSARRLLFQNWLLVAVRTLIIVLVVLAVAEPYSEALQSTTRQSSAHKIIAIDNSYSMAYRDDDFSRLEHAKQLAVKLVQDSGPADTFTILSMADPGRVALGAQVVDHATIIRAIEDVPQSFRGASLSNLAASIARAQRELREKDETASVPISVFVLTDLQQSTWSPAVVASQEVSIESPLEQLLDTLQPDAFTVFDLGETSSENTAVLGVETSNSLNTTVDTTTIAIELAHFGMQPRAPLSVELLVDGNIVAEQPVDLSNGRSSFKLAFSHRFESPGMRIVQVRAATDALPLDDSRWLVVPVKKEIRVLCVEGRERAAQYVAKALRPSRDIAGPIRPIIVTEAEFADLKLDQYDAVFFCNVGRLTDNESARLLTYLKNGGGVVYFLGDQTAVESYNRLVRESGDRLIPARIGDITQTPQFGMDPLNYTHPIVAPFRGHQRSGLLTTPVGRYFKLHPPETGDVEIAAATQSGDPFIVTAPVGAGRSAMVATDASLSSVDAASGEPWTQWPTWPSFLPIVRELLAYVSGGQNELLQREVGTALSGTTEMPSASQDAAVQVNRPDGQVASASIERRQGRLHWTYLDTDLPGVYQVHRAGTALSTFAVNLPAMEGNLARIDPGQLPPEVQVRTADDLNDQDVSSTSGTLAARAVLHEWLLWTALGLLFFELFLAWHFARRGI